MRPGPHRRREASARAVGLHLSVQYASTRTAPARDRVRRWIRAALALAANASARSGPLDDAALTVRFVDEEEARALNRQFRGRDYATNVLTFDYDTGADAVAARSVAADIVVCLPVVEREARDQGKAAVEHCGHLVIHGTLHACGFDHASTDEADAMEALERQALMRFRIADPYRIAHD